VDRAALLVEEAVARQRRLKTVSAAR